MHKACIYIIRILITKSVSPYIYYYISMHICYVLVCSLCSVYAWYMYREKISGQD